MNEELRIPQIIQENFPSLAEHCLLDNKSNLCLYVYDSSKGKIVIIERALLLEKVVDKEILVTTLQEVLDGPVPDVATRKKIEHLLTHLSKKLHIVNLYPESYRLKDMLETPLSPRDDIELMKRIIDQLEQSQGKSIPIDAIIVEADKEGLLRSEILELIEKLKRGGDIYSPKHGFVSRL